MRSESYYRLAILVFYVLDVCAVVAIISLLPSYFLSVEKVRSADASLAIQSNQPVPFLDTQALSNIKGLNDQLAIVENAEKNKFSVSEKVLNEIIIKKTPDIKITKISYSTDSTGSKSDSIAGTAPSREVLLSFQQALEADANFKSVDLPISNFVKGSNIQFSLSLIPS